MSTLAPGVLTPQSVPDSLHVAGKHLTGFARLPPEQAMLLRLRMEEAAHDCGCQWAAAVGGTALTAYLVWAFVVPYISEATTSFSWWASFGAALAGSLIGKALGTFRAKRTLEEAITEFDRLLTSTR